MTPVRHALISGGSSGIGLALARRLARQGWNLTLLARDPQRLAQAKSVLEADAPSVKVILATADVRDEAAVTASVAAAIAELGAPGLVVTSAGIVIPGTFADLPPSAFRDTMDVNYLGTVNVVRAALPAMRAQGSGRIVILSSGAGLIGLYGYTAYAPTKFAVRGFAEALCGELKPDGIGVSIVYPPDTDTPQLREEIKTRPAITSAIAGGAAVLSADAVADAILKGVAAGRFAIAPGFTMGLLNRLHSVINPLLHRFSFDPVIARMRGKERGG